MKEVNTEDHATDVQHKKTMHVGAKLNVQAKLDLRFFRFSDVRK